MIKTHKIPKQNQLLAFLSLIILLVIVFYPLLMMLLNSVGINVKSVQPTFDYYTQAFSDKGFFKALTNTGVLGISVTLLSLIVGSFFAFILARTDIPFKKIIRYLILTTFMIPSYIMAMSWIQLLGESGLLHFIPFQIYSLNGVIVIMLLHLYPMAFLAIHNALNKIDGSVEEAAKLDGCTHMQVFYHIIFPIIKPTLYAIGLFIFAKTISCFGVAALLAIPSRAYILSTYILKSMSTLKIQVALAISVVMMVLTAVLFIIQLKLSRHSVPSTIQGFSSKIAVKLRRFKLPLLIFLSAFFVVSLFLPVLTTIMNSFTKAWSMGWTRNNFTFGNYLNLFFNEAIFYRAIRNSFVFGIIASTIASFIALLTVYIQNRTRSKVRHFISFLNSIPMAVPEIIIAIAAIFAWMNPPLKLYNTPWILIISYVMAALPFAYKNISGLIKNITFVYEEMAMLDGVNRTRAFWLATVPQLKGGISSGWMLAFLFIIREIPISSLLYSSGNETIGVLLFNLRVDTGGMETLSAIAVLIIVLTLMGKFFTGVYKKTKQFAFNQSQRRGERILHHQLKNNPSQNGN
ncbi:MAG: ABC transporter permease [Thermotogota bacterium]